MSHPLPLVTAHYHSVPPVTVRHRPSPSVITRHHPLPTVTNRYRPFQAHQISAAERRQQYHDAKAAAERNRLRVLGDMGDAPQPADAENVAIGPGLAPPPKLPPSLAKRLDKRNSERDA